MSQQTRPSGMGACWIIWAGQVISLLGTSMANLGLIVQGLQDPNVTPENVRAVEKALGRAGVPYQLLGVEREGHGISKPKNHKVVSLSDRRQACEFTGSWPGRPIATCSGDVAASS